MSEFDKAQIVVLSSIDWESAWQRHQIFATQFASAGHEVFFVENSGFRNPNPSDFARLWKKFVRISLAPDAGPLAKRTAGLHVLPPRLLPPTFKTFRRINAGLFIPQLTGLLKSLGLGPHPVVIAHFPTATTLELIRRLSPSMVIYDCASNFRAHPHAPRDFAAVERELLRVADMVVCDSDFLFAQKKAEHKRVFQVHQGVDEAFFRTKPAAGHWCSFCYYGTWSPDVNADFLTALSETGFDVTVSGYVKNPAPSLPSAVTRLAPTTREDLPRRLERFEAFLFPYRQTPFHMGVVPAKIYECLAMGRPILATRLPSLEPFKDLIYIADTPKQWARIAQDLPKTETAALREARMAAARDHTHEREFARLVGHIRETWNGRPAVAIGAPQKASAPWWATKHIQAFLRGFTWIGFFYGLAKASTLLTQVFAGRLLGPHEYGKANLVVALAAFLQILPMMGFPLALSKFLSTEPSDSQRRAIVSTTFTVFAFWMAACLALFNSFHAALAHRLDVPDSLFVVAVVFALCNAFYVVISSPLLGLYRFLQRGLAETLYGLSAPFFLAALTWQGHHSYKVMIATLCLSYGAGSLYSLWALRTYLRPAFDLAALKSIGNYALVASLNLLTAACILAPARLFLNWFFTEREVGVFSAYFTSTAQISLAILYILSSVLVPLASNPEGQAEAWQAMRALGARLLLAVFGFFVLTALAAMSLFGRRYPFDWSWIFLFAGAASLILLHGVASALFSAKDFSGLRVSVAGNLIAGLGNVALGLVLIPRWGIGGAGLALLGAYVAGLAYYLVLLPKGERVVEA